MHSVTSTIFPVFALKVMHAVILLTWFCKLLTRVAILSGGHAPQVPQWHDASVCLDVNMHIWWQQYMPSYYNGYRLTQRLNTLDFTKCSFQWPFLMRSSCSTSGNICRLFKKSAAPHAYIRHLLLRCFGSQSKGGLIG